MRSVTISWLIGRLDRDVDAEPGAASCASQTPPARTTRRACHAWLPSRRGPSMTRIARIDADDRTSSRGSRRRRRVSACAESPAGQIGAGEAVDLAIRRFEHARDSGPARLPARARRDDDRSIGAPYSRRAAARSSTGSRLRLGEGERQPGAAGRRRLARAIRRCSSTSARRAWHRARARRASCAA